jgi:hypothetical protein
MERVYLAAQYERHPEMRHYREMLDKLGIKVTSRWIDAHGGQLTEALGEAELNADPNRGIPFALIDIEDIHAADTMISFTGAGRGGRHVEFGIAWANNKRLILVGSREHVFHTLPGVHCYPDFISLYYNIEIGAES